MTWARDSCRGEAAILKLAAHSQDEETPSTPSSMLGRLSGGIKSLLGSIPERVWREEERKRRTQRAGDVLLLQPRPCVISGSSNPTPPHEWLLRSGLHHTHPPLDASRQSGSSPRRVSARLLYDAHSPNDGHFLNAGGRGSGAGGQVQVGGFIWNSTMGGRG